MKLTRFVRLLGVALFLAAIPAIAAAQDSIKCEANNNSRKYCGSYGDRQVRLDRQISGSPCIEGQSWGVDDRGLWVERGCRAYFKIGRRDRGMREGGGDANSIKCESNDGGRKYCGSYGYNQVRMDRQISGAECVQGSSWGVDARGLWVDRGCRAYFSVSGGPGGGRGGNPNPENGWWERGPNDNWPPRGDWHGGRWQSGGACFYKDRDFGGSFFCMRRGEQRESLAGYGDDISSIRAFGGARVTVFDDRNFSGARQTLGGDVPDLRQLPVMQKPGHTWNNRISSLSVQ
ncbi:MAG TPA: DUF3011 domain-containing protein [Terriglobales bacterium]|nr:DUF3011 domain-containing protein [Terriglobales bacterium]